MPESGLLEERDAADAKRRVPRDAATRGANDELERRIRERTGELEKTLERLKQSERSFKLLVASVTDYAIFMLDPVGNIVSWNAGAERIKGYREDEIVGQHFSRFYTEEDRKADVPARGLRTACSEGRFETEGWRVRKDGSRFWANVIIDAIRDGGKLVGFAKVTRDITERRAAEAQLRQAQKLEAIGQFTGGAAHDFNNLLLAIGGSLELLRKRLPDDQRVRALLANAMQGVERGSALTQRMLAFTRRQDLKEEAVDVVTVVTRMFEVLDRSVGPMITLETRVPRELPRVRTDANQLETALLNLVLNARDAMPSGGRIVIDGSLERVTGDHTTRLVPGEYVRLSVVDTGEGMDEATLARATEPFFTTKGIGKGTGLGLSMVDGLMAQSKGRMVVRSRRGEGTTIELWLPVAAPEMIEAQTADADGQHPVRSENRLVILAVDDDPLVLPNIAAMLEDLGHTVIVAASGAKALEIVRSGARVDLVISDQAMPGMTGVQLAEALATQRPDLPVILATGYAEPPQGLGARLPRLGKPFSQWQLAEAVASVTRRG